jgi:transcriptional regulator GlxA family with amidase domain
MVGPLKIFNRANEYRDRQGKRPVFDIHLAGLTRKINLHDGLFTVNPEPIGNIKKTDLIIIPSLNHNYKESIQLNHELIPWMLKQYRRGASIASICTGAFLLAETGLLDGLKCSTHWSAAAAFQKRFPNVNVVADQVVTDENNICTNGGAYSFLNLILYLIEKYYDRDTALYCSKVFQIDPDRISQSSFALFAGLYDHEDNDIQKAQRMLEKTASAKISIPDLASKLAIGRRNFDRRFKKATGNTPLEYVQRLRIENAKRMLEKKQRSIQEVMYQVGYSDPKAFRDIFKKITGLTPVEYRRKFSEAFDRR